MEPMQLMSMLSVAGGIAGLTLGLERRAKEKEQASPLAEIADDSMQYEAEQIAPLGQRLFGPAKGKLGRLGRKFTPSSRIEKMRRLAVLAGLGSSGIESVLAVRAIGTAVGATLFPLAMAGLGVKFGGVIFFALVGGGLGFFLPGLWVSRLAKKRQHQIRVDLPETIDLMAISVQAGLGLEASIELASQSVPGPLGDECYRLLQEVQLGSSRRQALHQLRRRTDVGELSSFALSLVQADAIGSPLADVLQASSARMRMIRRQVAREKAAKLPVKLLIPMLLFIFPALFVVVIGPAAISIVTTIFGRV